MGVRAQTGLEPTRPRRKQRTAQEDWDLALAIVAVRRGYDKKPGFRTWLRTHTGKNLRQLKKLIDNMEQERGTYEAVKTNIADIEDRLKKARTGSSTI